MSDNLINKKEALTLLRKRSQQLVGIYGDLGGALSGAARLINELPSADKPQGEWIEDPINKNNMYCSNCKVSYTKDFLRGMSLYHEPKDTPHFCPNCGARMKGVDDETNHRNN